MYRGVHFDAILYTQFMTTPWNPARYLARLEMIKKWEFRKNAVQIALFQDEYFHGDLLSRFINELEIDHVFSVAAPTEWQKIYAEVDPKRHKFHEYLTGYIDEDDRALVTKISERIQERSVDIGYRTGWPSKEMYKLGHWGSLKFKIADMFLKYRDRLNLDIQLGTGFILGEKWFEFLCSCRYTIGVESGGSLLDYDGSITKNLISYLNKYPEATFQQAEDACFSGVDGNLRLRALSPRIFEAALCQTAMALVEGDYNGVVQAGIHYLPVKEDFSNVESVVEKMKDENLRRQLVENVNRDVVANPNYTYAAFVNKILKLVPTRHASKRPFFLLWLTELFQWTQVYLWIQKNKLLKKPR